MTDLHVPNSKSYTKGRRDHRNAGRCYTQGKRHDDTIHPSRKTSKGVVRVAPSANAVIVVQDEGR